MVAAVSLILTSAIFLDSLGRLLDLEFNQIKGYQAKMVSDGLNSASMAFQTRHWQGVRQAGPVTAHHVSSETTGSENGGYSATGASLKRNRG